MTSAEATRSAVMALLDVVEELCQGLASSQTPTTDWAIIVSDTLSEHREEMRESE